MHNHGIKFNHEKVLEEIISKTLQKQTKDGCSLEKEVRKARRNASVLLGVANTLEMDETVYSQGVWIRNINEDSVLLGNEVNACGTKACVAGHGSLEGSKFWGVSGYVNDGFACFLPEEKSDVIRYRLPKITHVQDLARIALGLTRLEADLLFDQSWQPKDLLSRMHLEQLLGREVSNQEILSRNVGAVMRNLVEGERLTDLTYVDGESEHFPEWKNTLREEEELHIACIKLIKDAVPVQILKP